jgi:integrase
MSRRGFGAVEKLQSGKHRARYTGPDGRRHVAPRTFPDRIRAESWLAKEHKLISRGRWTPPADRKARARHKGEAKAYTLKAYAGTWLKGADLKESTAVLYERLLRLHILPKLGKKQIDRIAKRDVSTWWGGLDKRKKRRTYDLSYSLLRTILYSAVEKELIEVNPCKVKGAGKVARRRSCVPLTPEQVADLAKAMPEQYRLGVLLGCWCGLRSGEIRELRRKDVGPGFLSVAVSRGVVRAGTKLIVTEPKTEAGKRSVAVPAALRGILEAHLKDHAQPGAEGLLIWDRATGSHVHDNRWGVVFNAACKSAGCEGYTFHDLRHIGLTYAATAGATIKELQAMAGHTTPTMAMRYQEVSTQHMAAVVDKLSGMIGA